MKTTYLKTQLQNVINISKIVTVHYYEYGPNFTKEKAQYIAENNLATKVAIIYDSSDIYSTGIYEKFVAEAENQNLEIVETQYFTKDTKTNFSVQVQ